MKDEQAPELAEPAPAEDAAQPQGVPAIMVLKDDKGREIYILRADGSALIDWQGIAVARAQAMAGNLDQGNIMALMLWNAKHIG